MNNNEDIRSLAERYRIVSELTSDYAYAFRVESVGKLNCEWVTGALEKITEYTQKELNKLGGWEKLIYPEDIRIPNEQLLLLLNGQSKIVEYRIVTKRGRIRWMRDYAKPLWDEQEKRVTFIYGAVQDITKRKKAESDLLQAQKLASIGQLAAGVAHEINNPLSAISGEMQWLIEKSKDKKLLKTLKFMCRITDRIAGIVNSLLTFSRETSMSEKKYEDISSLIDEILLLIERRLNSLNIKIKKKYAEKLPELVCSKGEIEQVFMNVLLNSADAMAKGGEIIIETKKNNSNELEIIFKDTGIGIDKNDISKIFDPFFTTKKTGEGTGLGLSVSHGIIKNHDGNIKITSKLNKGTKVIIKFPIKNEIE